tara:strand:- start:2646 stop:5519 length:2874 start_codon:yes stop_codon:yes gene_type:complete
MSVRSLNGLASGDTNVYINTNLTATLPLEENQSSFNNPIVISMKGLSGFGGAGKVIKVNSANNALEYADDNTEAITASLPLLRTGDVLSLKGLTTLGTANQIIKMNSGGTQLEYANDNTESITTSLPLLRTGDVLSLKGLTTLGTANQIIKMNSGGTALEYANDNTENITTSLPLLRTGDNITLKGLASLGSANQIIKMNSGGTQLEYANETDTIYTGSTNINISGTNVISITGTIPTGNGGTGITSYLGGDLIIGAGGIGPPNALTRLAIGTNGYVLKSNGSLPFWDAESVFDSTLATNFGTAVPGGNTVSLGNSQNSGQSTNVDIYTSTVLNIKNTSGATVATLSPVSSTCNLDLKGGVITTATLSTNTTWNGSTIAYNYGGTGLSSLTASKILQVNAGANGYNLVDLPVGAIYTGSTFINISATNVISIQNALSVINGGTGLNFIAVGDLLFGNSSLGPNIIDRLQIGTNGYVLKSNGTQPIWAVETDTTYTGSTNINISGANVISITGTIPTTNGGTGLSTLGTANQVLTVNSAGTALEYGTVSGSNFQLDASGNLSPVVIGNDLLVGTRNNTLNAKFVVDGTSRMSQIYCTYLESSSNIVCDIALPNEIRLQNNGQMRFYEAIGNGSSYIGLKGASSLGVNYDISLPSASGTLALTSQIGSSFWSAYSSLGTYTTGNVGIRNSTPNVPLAVGVQANGGGNFTSGFYARSVAQGGGFASNNGFSAWNPYPISIVAEGGGYFKTGYLVASDRRIKTNIEDVIDTDSLTKLRQIRCRNYGYIDKISRGNEKTIGFIAQEVKEVYPNAVSLEEEIIPDIYKNIDCVWSVDGDKFKMSSTDLSDVSGGEYLFYCKNNDDDDEGEDKIGIVGNDDNTFTFDNKYDTVFCYGKSVKDFNRLEPDKLFILNFSATQEIDKIQQTHINKIETLETELDIYKSIVNKLMNATSFKSFKESIA